ncbi:hypothetical protein JTE90_002800 [Oedothorax gibbosus]|uniref:Uncharacterized protein n=1 Tax=Oedothorax gibbosus TaxID=931172 RepID=A0AAV6TUV5_9ARAC|nr:hypothetical protein JTE90_002800 [Oedothorax gibbosus]
MNSVERPEKRSWISWEKGSVDGSMRHRAEGVGKVDLRHAELLAVHLVPANLPGDEEVVLGGSIEGQEHGDESKLSLVKQNSVVRIQSQLFAK